MGEVEVTEDVMTYELCANGEALAVPETQRERIVLWREERLLYAGWRSSFARTIAERLDLDLHRACRLMELGCDSATGWRILR
jgi:hypothetical protein